jgi:Nuclease-related domain
LDERKLLHLRRDDSCSVCAQPLPAGTQAYWLKPRRVVLCIGCADAEAPASAEAPPQSVAGASARREHDRYRQAREERQRAKYGRIGGWAARMSSGPQREQAWAKGAAGEEQNAKRFERLLADEPIVLLHDRRLPGNSANIDHLGIGPGGVTVIDSKNLTGKVRVDWHGGLFSERRFDLYVHGRRRTSRVESVERQIETVRAVLADEGMSQVVVVGAWCMTDVEGLPLLKRLKLRGIAIDGPRHVAKLIGRPGDLDPATIQQIAAVLDRRLPPA